MLKLNSQGNFIQAFRIGGNGSDVGTSIKTDASGNVFLAGLFSQTVDFNTGPGTQTLATGQPNPEGFVCKFSQAFQFFWVRQFGADMSTTVYDDKVDIDINAAGSVFVSGSFKGILNIGPGLSTFTALGASSDVFVCSFNGIGNLTWARQISGAGLEVALSVKLDNLGNLLVSGSFSATTDFDPGPLAYTLAPSGAHNGFVCKLSSGGNFIWARQFTGFYTGGFAETTSQGEIIYTGGFYNSVDLDPGPGSYSSAATGTNPNSFVSKLDASGNFVWGRFFKSSGYVIANCIGIDQFDNIYSGGSFNSVADFDAVPGAYSLAATGSQEDMFITRLDNSGNTIWAKRVGGTSGVQPMGISPDGAGNLYVGGFYDVFADFDPGSGTFTKTSAGGKDLFILKLSLCIDVPVTPGKDTTICAGNSVVINAAASGAVNWYPSSTSTTSLGTGTTLVTPTLSAGSYSYYAASSSCTMQGTRAPVYVQVHPLPSVTITAPQPTICAGSQVKLTALGAHTYTWSNSATGNTISVSPPGNTIYSVTGNDTITGCTANKMYTVYVSLCLGETELLPEEARLYPNPATEQFFLHLPRIAEITLSNSTGQLIIKQAEFSAGIHPISLSGFPAGIYFLKLSDGYKTTLRLVKE